MPQTLSPLHTLIEVGLGGVLLAHMLVAWLDGHPRNLPTGEATDESQKSNNITGANRRTFTDASRHRAKSATLRRARSDITHYERRHWNWAGANPCSAGWIGTWGRRVPKWRDGKISRPGWRRSRWGKWAQCLPGRSPGWRARISMGIGSWSCVRSPKRWGSTKIVATIQRISTTDCGSDGRAQWPQPSYLFGTRLPGGKLNQAKKGALRFPVPVGFCYDEQGRIIRDPDEEVQGAVSLVFRLFQETGSAFGVRQCFAESELRFPQRSYGGAWDGKIIGGRLTHRSCAGQAQKSLLCRDVCLGPVSVSPPDQPSRRGS